MTQGRRRSCQLCRDRPGRGARTLGLGGRLRVFRDVTHLGIAQGGSGAGQSAFAGRCLAQQDIVKHLARDRRGRLRTEAAVFDDDGQGQSGVLGRSKGHEQGVIPVSLGNATGIVLLILSDADHLGSPGLARRQVLGATAR